MTNRLFFLCAIFISLDINSQIDCNDIKYSSDTLALVGEKIYSGECASKTRKYITKNYFQDGILDSIKIFDKNGKIVSIERFCGEFSTLEIFYKNGVMRESIKYRDDRYFGFMREYYKNGKIKYEAEYVDNELKNDSHFTWDKKGRKYLHSCVEKSKSKRVGKLRLDSGYRHCSKTLVKDVE